MILTIGLQADLAPGGERLDADGLCREEGRPGRGLLYRYQYVYSIIIILSFVKLQVYCILLSF